MKMWPTLQQAAAQLETNTAWSLGLWSQSNHLDPRLAPEVQGLLYTAGWADLQPSPDTWYWDEFDKQVAIQFPIREIKFPLVELEYYLLDTRLI